MDPSALPSRAADLVDAARDVPALPPEALARVKADVLARRPSRSRGLPLGLRFALLTSVVLASVATAKGTMLLWRRYVAVRVDAPAPRAPVRRAKVEARREPVVEPIAPRVAAEAPAAAPAPEVAAPAPRRRAAPVERRAPDAADAATEAQLLAGALARLRGAHDPRGAMTLLDQYAKAYPRGVLATEALSARLEAALALNDRPAALKLLDGRSTFAGRLGAEQLLTRAELRASAGRYADALADFDRLLGTGGPAAPAADAERALYGRAVTLGHLGRAERARADLVAYQQRFPGGKHAGEVARLLKGAEKRP
jgi:tetratricopeptide (TPR) repeat protein